MTPDNFSQVRGFNYSPSYASSGLEVWQMFDGGIVAAELERGLQHFPSMNTIRPWLSYEAFSRAEARFLENFESLLSIGARLGLRMIPVLFNRWHDPVVDFGGTYIDHIRKGSRHLPRYQHYVEAVVGRHSRDERILAWDLCNEPLGDDRGPAATGNVQAETAWLEQLYRQTKDLGATAPITVGVHPLEGVPGLARVESISDVLSIHPYFIPFELKVPHGPYGGSKRAFRVLLDQYVEFADRVGKPLLATECCWGSLDDDERAELISINLEELQKRNIGWLAHLLQHSLIADAHRPEFGPVGPAGYMGFVEPDGSLRRGHGVFNQF